jgi:hypothetical protein
MDLFHSLDHVMLRTACVASCQDIRTFALQRADWALSPSLESTVVTGTSCSIIKLNTSEVTIHDPDVKLVESDGDL